MAIVKNRRITLAKRPDGTEDPAAKHFGFDEQSTIDTRADSLKDGQILVRTHYISLDPYLVLPMGRTGVHPDNNPEQEDNKWKLKQFKDASIIFNIGQTFGGRGVGKVVASKHANVSEGDYVAADWGYQEYAVVDVHKELTFEKLESDIFGGENAAPLSTALGMLGVSGSHALWGYNYLRLRLEEKEEEKSGKTGKTLVVSGAAGNIGTVVLQLAKMDGYRVVAIAGGPTKCDRLAKQLHVDATVDYKKANGSEEQLSKLIAEACPGGVDAYFDNVGGVVTDAVHNNLNRHSRVYMCGAISQYSSGGNVTFTDRQLAVHKEKNVTAIPSSEADYIAKIPEARKKLAGWMREGKLVPLEWITDGIENTPKAFEGMYCGANFGKTIIKVIQ